MAYGYGSWSQIAAPKTSSSSTVFSSAGDIFNKAIEAGQSTVDKYLQYKDENLASAKEENLANLKLQLLGKAQQGLETYDPAQDFYTPQNIQGIYDKFIDPLAAAKAVETGRSAAVDQTTKKLLAKSDADWQALQQGNLTALEKAANELPGASQFLALDPSGSLVPLQGAETPEGQAAINQFAQIAEKYGFKPIDRPLEIRRNLETQLVNMGAEPQEIKSITKTFEAHQSDRGTLDEQSKSLLDREVANLTDAHQVTLANIDKAQEDFFRINDMSLESAYVLGEYKDRPFADVIKENWGDGNWIRETLQNKYGGENLIKRINEIRSEGSYEKTLPDGTKKTYDLKGVTDNQIIYALLNSGEIQNTLLDETVDMDVFMDRLIDVAKNSNVTDAVIKQRMATYNSFAAQRDAANRNYDNQVSAAGRFIKNQAGFQDTSTNSAIIRSAIERARTAGVPTRGNPVIEPSSSAGRVSTQAVTSGPAIAGPATPQVVQQQPLSPAAEQVAAQSGVTRNEVVGLLPNTRTPNQLLAQEIQRVTTQAPAVGQVRALVNQGRASEITPELAQEALVNPSDIPEPVRVRLLSIIRNAALQEANAIAPVGNAAYNYAGNNATPPPVQAPIPTQPLGAAIQRYGLATNPNQISDSATPAQTAELSRNERLQGTLFEVARSLQNVPTLQLQQMLQQNLPPMTKLAIEIVLRNR